MKTAVFSAIVPAAGKGTRLQKAASLPLAKPFLEIGGMPVLARTLKKLDQVPEIKEIIVASAPENHARIRGYAKEFSIKKLKRVIVGGAERSDSVWNGLRAADPRIPNVLVHDGVRPFIETETIRKLIACFVRDAASGWVAGKPMIPTVKEVENGRVIRTLDRSRIWEIQTPQLFSKRVLIDGYAHIRKNKITVTDEASIAEALGCAVKVMACEENNFKITTLQDLKLAARLLETNQFRVGLGEDLHRLVEKRALYLGGVKIPSQTGALGHSDGDVVLHAVIDALLGALGRGDIGDYFSDLNPRFKNIRSPKMLAPILELTKKNGYEIVNVDCVIHLQEPRLGPYKEKIRCKVAALLGIAPQAVGMKAKTGEGLGAVGLKQAVAARAIVNLRRKEIWCA